MSEQEEILSKWREKIKRGFLRVIVLHMFNRRSDGLLNGNLIRKLIREKTSDGWYPSPGSIYPILSEMETDGIITEVSTENDKNREYKITKFGKTVYQMLLEDLDFFGSPASKFTKFSERFGSERFKEILTDMSVYELKKSYENTKTLLKILEDLLQDKILTDETIQ